MNGVLAVARAIGDRNLKEQVISTPSVVQESIYPNKDEFLVLACDGLWDVMDGAAVIEFIYQYKKSYGGSTEGVAEALVNKALELGSADNVSILIVFISSMSVSRF